MFDLTQVLTIRFNRIGKRNKAQFRIVVQEHTIAPGGRHAEVLGSWDPHSKKGVFNGEKINEWIKRGAQVSDSVYNLLVKQKVIQGEKRAVKIKKAEVSPEAAEAPKTEAPKEEVKAEETKPEEIKKEGE